VYYASTPIQIDGREDDPAWADAPAIDLRAVGEAEVHLRAKALWDEANVYFFFSCDGGGACGKQFAVGSAASPRCAAQVQVAPNPSESDAYLGFKLDEKAEMHTYLNFGGSYLFRELHANGLRASIYLDPVGDAHSGNRHWSAEIAIPWMNTFDLNRTVGANVIWKARLGCSAKQGLPDAAGWPLSGALAEDARAIADFGEWVFVK
jgi:hypothetical protein